MSADGDSDSSLPERTCPKCGESFTGVTAKSANEKIENHVAECDAGGNGPAIPENASDGEDARYKVSLTPPRHPDEYWLTDHCHSMIMRREQPEITSEVLTDILEHGVIHPTHERGRFIFDLQRGWDWRLVVDLNDEAFINPEEKHRAVTVYAKDSAAHREVTKYV